MGSEMCIRDSIHTPRIHWNAGAIENLQRHCKGLYKKLCSEMQIDMGDCEVLMPAVQLALNSNETGRAPAGKETSPLQEMTRVPKRGALDAVVTGTTIETAEVQHISEEVWDTVRDRMTAVRAALAEYRPQRVTAEKKLAKRQKRNRATPPTEATVQVSTWQGPLSKQGLGRRAMETPKPTRGSVGPGTLDQELQEPRGSTRTRLPARSLLTPRGTRRQRWQQPRGYYHMRITEGPRAEGARKASSQRVQGLQEPQGAPTATRHQQEVPRAPGGQRQQSSTTTNHGPRDPMFTDTAGQVPGRWPIPTKSASCTRDYYQPSADPGQLQ